MKRNVFFVMLFALVAFTSCQKADDNGDLGGFWKLMQIEYLSDGSMSDLKEKSRFMAVQLDLMHFTGVGSHYARFNYRGDSLHIQMIENNASAELLAAFGFDGQEQHFLVERLNDKKLVLCSLFSRLTFKKF